MGLDEYETSLFKGNIIVKGLNVMRLIGKTKTELEAILEEKQAELDAANTAYMNISSGNAEFGERFMYNIYTLFYNPISTTEELIAMIQNQIAARPQQASTPVNIPPSAKKNIVQTPPMQQETSSERSSSQSSNISQKSEQRNEQPIINYQLPISTNNDVVVKKLWEEVAKLKTEIDTLSKKVEDLDKDNSELQEKIKKLEQKVAELNEKINEQDKEFKHLNKENNELEKRVQTLQQQNKDIEMKLQATIKDTTQKPQTEKTSKKNAITSFVKSIFSNEEKKMSPQDPYANIKDSPYSGI